MAVSLAKVIALIDHCAHLVLGPFNYNFSCPMDPMAVQLLSNFHAGLNEVEFRPESAILARGIDQGLILKKLKIC